MNWGLGLAVLGVVVAWLVYRADRWTERRGVIHALESELEMHRLWLRNPYSADAAGTWTSLDYMPFKLATVAVDNAIVRGPSLFLNPGLGISLVGYRQGASNLNQMIDRLMALQGNAELWVLNPPPELKRFVIAQIEAVHIRGIGDDELGVGAHALYLRVRDELDREKKSNAPELALWFVTGFSSLLPQSWRTWLGRRGEQARPLAFSGWRSIAGAVSPPKVPPQPGPSE